MMFNNRKYERGFDWSEFASGILFILLAIYFFRRPSVALGSLVVLAALLAIIRGIVSLSSYSKFRRIMPISWTMVVAGIVDILIGLVFLFDNAIGSLAIAYLFAIWFIVDSIAGILTSNHLKNFGTIWFVLSIIFDALGLILGIMMLIRPFYAAFTVTFLISWFFLIIGINNVIVAFARRF
ncbi:HdeD family acid-resistance protein [Agrilactobacillus yilanensis]|uniref:HdeD family acid-resistance protein n=1 Tax=Agrilactobacillus yilanensis TaxID=2485997 RepID=A0ABW4J978_9LACO|nr:DUF308 domain-containing protein [Agrilactobacillus yilanensis]